MGAGAARNCAGCHGGAAATLGTGGSGFHGEVSTEGKYPKDAGPHVLVQRRLLQRQPGVHVASAPVH